MPTPVEAEPPPPKPTYTIKDVMACLTECNNNMEYSPDVEFSQNYNDNMMTCLTQLHQSDKEAEFLKEHCGDGWHDEAHNKPEKKDQYLKKTL